MLHEIWLDNGLRTCSECGDIRLWRTFAAFADILVITDLLPARLVRHEMLCERGIHTTSSGATCLDPLGKDRGIVNSRDLPESPYE